MKHKIYLSALIILSLSCNKEKFFDGPDFYEDGFEDYLSTDEMFSNDDVKWSYNQVTIDGNYFEIDTTHAHTGNKSIKFFAKKSPEGSASKCSIAKQNMAFWEGETVRISAWYFIEGNAPADWMFIMDAEEQVPVGAGPGMRIALESDGKNIVVEHKFANPNIYQEGTKIDFPRNQWVNLVMELKLSQKKKGTVRIYQDGVLIIQKDKWKTLPKDFLHSQQGTKGMYSSVEFGITANSTQSDMTLYLDDVKVEKI